MAVAFGAPFRIWILALIALLHVRGQVCFDDAIPVEQRKLVGTGSESYPLGIWPNDWAAGHLTSDVVQILAEEILGFRVTRKGPGPGTVDGFFALVGCGTPTNLNDRGCGDGPSKTYTHIVVEGWTESYMPTWMKIQQDYPDTAPKNLGNMGYYGKTSMYLSEEVQQRAWEAEGLNLEFYKGYNVSWHNAARHFDPPSSIDVKKLKRCNETRLTQSEAMSFYAELTGDVDGIETVNGQVRGKCWDEYFWYPPSCRATPSQCLPFLTAGTGWNLEETMQKATAWNMQISPVVALTWGDFTQLPSQGDMTFYWWVPDPTFLGLKPLEITFPTFDRAAHNRGDKRTAPSSISIDKYVSQDLSRLAPVVEEMLKALRIEMQMVNDMLLDQINTKDNSTQVACRWLKANKNTWKAWLPDNTKCFAGFGLHHQASNRYVTSRADPAGLACKACPSGSFSEELFDDKGSTFICTPCKAGTAQASGAALTCDACPSGQYQDKEGSSSCKRCGIGEYQNQKGLEKCEKCPQGTSTPGLGSSTMEDCGCEENTINVAEGAGNTSASGPRCAPCGEGLECPFAGTLEGLQTGNATESHLESPSVKPGYSSSTEKPLELFKCSNAVRCPGGLPSQCASTLQGVTCAECPQGESWDGQQCIECSGAVVGLWSVCMAAIILGLPGLYYVSLRSVKAKADLKLTAMIFFNMLVSLAQTVALIGMMTIEWPGLFKAMTSSSQVLLLDLEASHLACVGGASSSVRYVLATLAFPTAFGWLLLSSSVSQCLPARFRWERPRTLNTMGTLMQVSFNMMSSISLQPFMCYSHPNGLESLVKYPSILCGEEAHTLMQVVGAILLTVFVMGFFALSAWAAMKMPAWGSRNMRSHVGSFLFLISRFRLDCWWFGVPLLLRGPLLSLPVVFAPDFPEAQMSIGAFVLAIFLFIQVLAWPWKVPLLNVLDFWATLWLLVLMLSTPVYNSAMERTDSSLRLKEQLSTILLSFVLLALIAVVVAIFTALIQLMRGNSKSRWLDLTFLRGQSAEPTGEMLRELAEELMHFSAQELSWQMGQLNPHDLATIDKCIALLTAECGVSLSRTYQVKHSGRVAAAAVSRGSVIAPSLAARKGKDADDVREQKDEETADHREQKDEETANHREQKDEETANHREQKDEETANHREQKDETANCRPWLEANGSLESIGSRDSGVAPGPPVPPVLVSTEL